MQPPLSQTGPSNRLTPSRESKLPVSKLPSWPSFSAVSLAPFCFFVLIGVTCKFANRPKSNARPHAQAKGMYQPSAAGYGTAAAATYGGTYRGNESMHDVSSPNAGLLDSAQPMGRGGQYEEADSSLGSSQGLPGGNITKGGFGMIPSASASSFSGDEAHRFAPSRGGHARGASSGIELPGPQHQPPSDATSADRILLSTLPETNHTTPHTRPMDSCQHPSSPMAPDSHLVRSLTTAQPTAAHRKVLPRCAKHALAISRRATQCSSPTR